MMNRTRLRMLALLISLAGPAVTTAADVGVAFRQGKSHFSLLVGSGRAFDQSYTVIGIGASYYVVDGFSVGLGVESWSGADPGITKVTPSVGYVFHQAPGVKPYLGVFYRRSYIEDLEDLDSYGGRAGIYVGGGRTIFGIGATYEKYQDCQESRYVDCDDTYPEFSILFTF